MTQHFGSLRVNLNRIKKSVPTSQKTAFLHYEGSSFNVIEGMVAVSCYYHTEHINTPRGQNAFQRDNAGFKVGTDTTLLNCADRNTSCVDIRSCLSAAVVG